jgi:hypothetical protein
MNTAPIWEDQQVSVVAWIATPRQIESAAETGLLRHIRPGEEHEHILAATGYDAEPSGSCALLMGPSRAVA